MGFLQDQQCHQKVQELQKLLEVAESCHKREIKMLRENYEKKLDESDLQFQRISHAVEVSISCCTLPPSILILQTCIKFLEFIGK